MELWKIGNSPPAPKFNVISKPNDWSATVTRASKAIDIGEITDTKRTQFEYWTKLWEMLGTRAPQIRGTKPRPQHWTRFSLGRAKFGMNASVNTQKQFIRVGVKCLGPQALAHFMSLKQQRQAIEAEIGSSLEWEELPGKKECRIALRKSDVDPMNQADWPRQHDWLVSKLESFDKAFRPRIRALDTNDYPPIGSDENVFLTPIEN